MRLTFAEVRAKVQEMLLQNMSPDFNILAQTDQDLHIVTNTAYLLDLRDTNMKHFGFFLMGKALRDRAKGELQDIFFVSEAWLLRLESEDQFKQMVGQIRDQENKVEIFLMTHHDVLTDTVTAVQCEIIRDRRGGYADFTQPEEMVGIESYIIDAFLKGWRSQELKNAN